MICKCGGILEVVRIEEYPNIKNKLDFNRLCDVKCIKCGKIQYSQPYDMGSSINKVKDLSNG